MRESLEVAQDRASVMLATQYDEQRGFPLRAGSHGDLWPGDRWVEAYIAINETERAAEVMAAITRSIRPDGSVPHLMQGSHKRLGLETNWIDRWVYRRSGNGALRLQNGECVTEIFAPPTLGLSALALQRRTSELPSGLTLGRILNSTLSLYGQRAAEDGLIYARHNDELTNGSTFTPLAQALKRDGKVMDPAVNALAVINGRAISEIITGSPDVDALPASLAHTDAFKSEEALLTRLHDDRAKGPFTHPEQVLAAVRLGRSADLVTDAELASIFSPTHAGGSHPERHGLSVTENIEIARLLPDREESHIYLARVLGKIAKSGAITRYEDAIPGHNPIKNKMNRRQLWLPTAAEIVQIDPNLY